MPNLELIAKWLGLGVGVIISGEALALFIGAYFVLDNISNWRNIKNLLFLIVDFISGISLIVIIASNKLNNYAALYVILSIIILTHLFREIEYFIGITKFDKFCSNLGLFIVNNFKILLPVILFFIRPF